MSEEHKRKRSLTASLYDGIFACAMTGFTQDYFVPFLLLLGAGAKFIGTLGALPNLSAALVQLKSADLTVRYNSRKRIITHYVLLQALMLLPLTAIAWIRSADLWLVIFIIVVFVCCGAFVIPPWGSLMSDLVKEDERGTFFGWRNRIIGFVTVGAALTAGVILNTCKKYNAVYHGFALIFAAAFIFRLISLYFLHKMHDPPLHYKEEHHFTLYDFISRVRESNFAKFVLFVACLNFSVNMASPFFSVFMLRELGFSYLTYTLVIVTAPLSVTLLMSRWGRHADKVGNLKVIRLTASLIGFIPWFWIINHHPLFLILSQVFAGFLWSGFNLCCSNFIYDAVMPEKRIRCIAYFNVFNGIALCLGSLAGGFLLDKLPGFSGYKILSLFIISSALRLSVGWLLPGRLKEVRSVEKVHSLDLFFSVIGIRPVLGVERKVIRY
ncbi:MAG: MFS transporter [Candidatus Schekmanbacteria bacterium]|nr:MFS transporter [Candidatus Schekmanbacteria bacterium]